MGGRAGAMVAAAGHFAGPGHFAGGGHVPAYVVDSYGHAAGFVGRPGFAAPWLFDRLAWRLGRAAGGALARWGVAGRLVARRLLASCIYGAGFAWFLPILPLAYATYWYSGVPYYYANDVYYTWNPSYDGYVATDPPPVGGFQRLRRM